ncbi:ATP-binding endoribonuclease [Colletotrichum truncatum]|uniref:ATP-binding endoribonuclease n=1 Tax=Colletotrichum truncatum TaxID=5467 RepID=A0ACC3Z4H6_COLTU|nr:ATP-binding endoribonuclease [Colletotrichum truncatum]KAF6788546.1 ATP-binding endoribonuclease [Colletotrichum truncatum]
MSSEQLNVIALVSGGKDSFFSALHCQRNGHRLVALANLFPAAPVSAGPDATRSAQGTTLIFKPQGGDGDDNHVKDVSHLQLEKGEADTGKGVASDEDADLNSFMYQTVGHQVIPLYAEATGLPLYRQPIYGGAKYEGRDYDSSHAVGGDAVAADADETESMVPLLRTIMAHHPEANALCAGAILSTYQRTRVESVALRLGLTPLAYLWKYPVLPPVVPGAVEDAQLLHDMAAAGLDARIIKVASAGLDDEFLWERVSSLAGAGRVKRALRRFGAAEGSVLGEGGEFETIVLDGPPGLFRKAIDVPESGRRIVREGGGTSWLSFSGASVREKPAPETAGESCSPARVPDVLDPRFQGLLDSLPRDLPQEKLSESDFVSGDGKVSASVAATGDINWTIEADVPRDRQFSVEEETEDIVQQIQGLLAGCSPPLPRAAITNTVIVLRRMSDFPTINKIYGRLFQHPNPPSRVTISCGNLPQGKSINIHLTVKPKLEQHERNGLHVQSRSYWAPANIGPYSQAIDVPLSGPPQGEVQANGVRAVTIAGQIPLVPASMILPTETTGNLEMQIILSLQHLWRIAIDMKVQLWTSAVAYFPNTPNEADKRRQAQLAAVAWKGAHAPDGDDDEDNEGGPDLWDRKYNPQYMSLGGGEDTNAEQKLPDWSVIKSATANDDDEVDKPMPPFFAVEVEELPRQAGVEWHAHLGLSRLPSSSVEYQTFDLEPSSDVPFYRRICHVVVNGGLVHSTISWLAIEDHKTRPPASSSDVDEWMRRAYLKATGSDESAATAGFPYLMYVSNARVKVPGMAAGYGHSKDKTTAFVYARSIWGGDGEEVLAVGLFK